MCLFVDAKLTCKVFKERTPDDWMVGWKHYDVDRWRRTWKIVSPYQCAVLNLRTQLVVAKGRVRKTLCDIDNKAINAGIHVYTNFGMASGRSEAVVKVYGQVKDLIAVGDRSDAVFRKIIIDFDDLMRLRKMVGWGDRT